MFFPFNLHWYGISRYWRVVHVSLGHWAHNQPPVIGRKLIRLNGTTEKESIGQPVGAWTPAALPLLWGTQRETEMATGNDVEDHGMGQAWRNYVMYIYIYAR